MRTAPAGDNRTALGEELIRAGDASKGQVEGGLVLQSRLVTCALFAAVVALPLAAITVPAEAQKRAWIFTEHGRRVGMTSASQGC